MARERDFRLCAVDLPRSENREVPSTDDEIFTYILSFFFFAASFLGYSESAAPTNFWVPLRPKKDFSPEIRSLKCGRPPPRFPRKKNGARPRFCACIPKRLALT